MSAISTKSTGRACAGERLVVVALATLLGSVLPYADAQAQPRQTAARADPAATPAATSPPPTARQQAPFDSTGYWVALVTEAWRFRMVVPGPGDYDEIPLSLAGKQLADQFDAAKEEAAGHACEAYGAPVVMWLPTRLHISWTDDQTLRVDTDAGMQTRLLKFKPTEQDRMAAPSLQGLTSAQWVIHTTAAPGALRQVGPETHFGYIKAVTTHLTAGYLRKNGVPYGGATTSMREYWEQHTAPGGSQWLIVTTYLTDPVYLADPYVFSPTFRKEPDGSQWHPQPCSLQW